MSVSAAKFSALSLTQLNEMLEDEAKLDQMAQETEEVQSLQLSKEMILASNRSIAEENLLYRPQLDSLKAALTQKYQELQSLFDSHQIKKTKLDQQSNSASLETLLALLQAEGAKIEEETENMAEAFLNGEGVLDSFIDEYQSKRKLAHLRRVKIEKLQEIVMKGQRLPQGQLPVSSQLPEITPATQPAFPSDSNAPPSVVPRRVPPPPPPTQPLAYPTPFNAAANLPYAASPYPPLPPRVGIQTASQVPQPAYPGPFMSQYPPALPQRPPPRLPPNPGFILQ
ncbi:vacuolar protein sorting-associated protein 37B [Microcaecilia unicolor]|uniref:Vacuolar protein sorting-associated protein 37B n=1 Tax=Microcaecilia unicolor TaxID=1415580 RepID=A0A6P7ZH62_9AMPH|nr:vacuolar protein sorting-associated protein 37B [Microcaecilia unicolor]